jgi:hypothetical protein
MIATAIALQDATKDAVMDKYSLDMACMLFRKRKNSTDKQFQKMLFEYSAHLSSLTTSLVMNAMLTKSQLDEMIDTIKEMENMEKDITNE